MPSLSSEDGCRLHLVADLNFPSNGYSIMLSVFYIPFATLVVPGVMITRKVGPHWSLPAMMMGWGAMATINAAAGSFAGCLVIRLCKCYAYETSV
jgi:hypothetical protein